METKKSVDKPLLVMQYEPGKVLWRLFFPNSLVILIIFPFFSRVFNFGIECNMKDCYILGLFSLIVIGVIFISIEMFLVKEIRLYEHHIEKEWFIVGTKSLAYTNARMRGITSWIASNKGFLYINKPNWYRYKCCGYDEHLISKENKEKAIEVISQISNRDEDEFKKARVEINPLIQK
ncbi:MAG: hypothetical protein K0U38_09815 [Epsilonproteobacteria bacterium]|nr:hypothetical protein [Campylobacterota bacterium]